MFPPCTRVTLSFDGGFDGILPIKEIIDACLADLANQLGILPSAVIVREALP